MKTMAVFNKNSIMKNSYSLLIICVFFSGSIFCQDSTLNSICNQLDSSLTNNMDQNEKIVVYNNLIGEALLSISDSLHESFADKLDSTCLTAKTLKKSSLETFFVKEGEPMINFLNKTCTKEWSSNEVELQIRKLQKRHNYSEEFTASIVYELCKHIRYENYIFFGELFQYRLIERLANHLKNEQQLNE